MMSASLDPTSLTFAASVAPQLITSLSSNSPPLFYSQASAMHPSPVVALSHPGLILSPTCDPFPQALVQRVRAGQFVGMQDLADNIGLLSQLSSLKKKLGLSCCPLSIAQGLREVPSLVSWMYCFVAYVAIRTPYQLIREMPVYSWLIIREALKHGSPGWAKYDRVFRRQLLINPLLSWNTLERSLQAATTLGQRNTSGTLCSLCLECDHTSSQCALPPLQQQLQPAPSVVVAAPHDVWRRCSIFVLHGAKGIVPGNSAP